MVTPQKKTRELAGERDNARCMQARKTTHGVCGQHQDMDETIRMSEDTEKCP